MILNSGWSVYLIGVFGSFAGIVAVFLQLLNKPLGKWPEWIVKKNLLPVYIFFQVLNLLVGGGVALFISDAPFKAWIPLTIGFGWPVILQVLLKIFQKLISKFLGA